MSDTTKNQVLIVLGIVTSLGTIGGTMVQVGSLKGEIIARVNQHETQLGHHGEQIEVLRENVADLKARVHGVASQVGKVPGRVAAKLESNPPTNNTP